MSGNEFMTALTKMDNPNPEGNVFQESGPHMSELSFIV